MNPFSLKQTIIASLTFFALAGCGSQHHDPNTQAPPSLQDRTRNPHALSTGDDYSVRRAQDQITALKGHFPRPIP